jgi:hypothetical protein
MAQPTVDLKNRHLAAFLAWLVPGLGHLYQGRRGKAALFAATILGLYFVGLVLGDWKIVYWKWTTPMRDPENFRASYLCQFWVGLAALPGLIQATLQQYDLPAILWGYLAPPSPQAVNALHPRLGKLVEVGWVYTVVAGLLNVLAIYDAYEGPAYPDAEPEAPAAPAGAVENLNAGAGA